MVGGGLVAKSCPTVALQALLSVGFPRQEYWSGLPFPPPGDLPNPGIKPGSLALQADSSPTEPSGQPLNTGWLKANKSVGCIYLAGLPVWNT